MTDERVDLVVVGGGIVGLATAWRLSRSRPDLTLTVVEKEHHVGAHQSGHNSGVVHAGVYYAPGSWKAHMCRNGKRLLERYAAERGIPLHTNGKIVVASRDEDLRRLRTLAARARANGVPGARLLDAAGLREVEPAATGIAALHSPTTAVTDFAAICRALAADLAAGGVEVRTGLRVTRVAPTGRGHAEVHTEHGVLRARMVACCAGLLADRLAGPAAGDLRVVPFRGSWYLLRRAAGARVRGSIYPVPDPGLPFLGVHVTRRVDGTVWAGPNAFLALARERYRRLAVDPRDLRDILTFAGLWRFGARNLGAAAREFGHEASRSIYARALSRYLPGITAADLVRGPIGIRAQAMHRDGTLADDFLIREDREVLHVLCAPSPAATAALAIADHIGDRVQKRLHSG